MSARKHLENGKDTLLPMMSACFYNCIYLLLILIYTIPHLLSYKPFMGSASHVLAFPKKDFLTECIQITGHNFQEVGYLEQQADEDFFQNSLDWDYTL